MRLSNVNELLKVSRLKWQRVIICTQALRHQKNRLLTDTHPACLLEYGLHVRAQITASRVQEPALPEPEAEA